MSYLSIRIIDTLNLENVLGCEVVGPTFAWLPNQWKKDESDWPQPFVRNLCKKTRTSLILSVTCATLLSHFITTHYNFFMNYEMKIPLSMISCF